jgi:hypothetical protein
MEVKHEEETSGAILEIENAGSGSLHSYHVATISREDAAADDSDASKMFLAFDDVDEKECQYFPPIK